MKSEQQTIAIAEACGIVSRDQWGLLYKTPLGVVRVCPDYLTDLNAMHEVEKLLTEDQAEKFRAWLLKLNGYNHDRVVSCTAPQRAEALLRTIGEWEDDKC